MATNTPAAPAPMAYLSKLADAKDHEVQPSTAHIPPEVKAFVNAAHAAWKITPKKWRDVELGNQSNVDEVRKMATKFAKATGRTFQFNSLETTDTLLVYKVRDAIVKTATAKTTDVATETEGR